MSNLKGKNILLGVTGGISIYKSCELVRALIKEGANIDIVMTPNAEKFVSKMTFQSLSGRKVYTNMYDSDESSISHIDLADNSDLIVAHNARFDRGFLDRYLAISKEKI